MEAALIPAPPTRAVQETEFPDAPPTVSARGTMLAGLPPAYTEGDFIKGFLEGLAQVLDPVVATLDSLRAHLDFELAPDHVLAGMAAWLGVAEVEQLDTDQRREVVRRAGDLGRLRGTREGLQLALELFFPGVPMRIDDHGKVVVLDADESPPPAAAPSFDVYCDEALGPETQMAVAGCIERWKPVHARYRLRVRKGDTGETLIAPPPAEPEGDG